MNPLDIVIDPDFASLVPPLSPEEYGLLETELVLAGRCEDRLVVWAPYNILLDGHHRRQICIDHNLPFEIREIELASREAAVAKIYLLQLSRRNLKSSQQTLMLGRLYNLMKKEGFKGNQYTGGSGQIVQNQTTAESLAGPRGLSEKTVRRAGQYADAVDFLKQATDPDLENKINAGTESSMEATVNLAKLIRSGRGMIDSEPDMESLVADVVDDLENELQAQQDDQQDDDQDDDLDDQDDERDDQEDDQEDEQEEDPPAPAAPVVNPPALPAPVVEPPVVPVVESAISNVGKAREVICGDGTSLGHFEVDATTVLRYHDAVKPILQETRRYVTDRKPLPLSHELILQRLTTLDRFLEAVRLEVIKSGTDTFRCPLDPGEAGDMIAQRFDSDALQNLVNSISVTTGRHVSSDMPLM